MNGGLSMESRAATRIGGWSLILAATGFMAVFAYLAARFNYPDVLDGTAADVLPQLLALGSGGRAVWFAYALLPLLLIPAAVGTVAALRHVTPHAMRAALVFAAIASVSMLLGLARWPTIHWELGRVYASAGPESRAAINGIFTGLNTYLGNFIGEFLGEISLSGFFVLSGYGLIKTGRHRRGYAGIVAGVFGLIAALRNVTDAVGPIAEGNNYVLPAWLITLGIVLVRYRPQREGFTESYRDL